MSGFQIARRVAASMLILIGTAIPARAQQRDPAADASIQLGPLALSPSLRLTNVGHDSNALLVADGPRSDVTATASPSANAWFRLPAVRVSGRSQFDFIYYHRLTDLRAVDTDNSARVEVPLNRFTPYVAGSRLVTRHRRNLEIDAPVKRLDQLGTAGADLRLTGKMTVGVSAWRSRVQYSGDTLYLGNDLAYLLNRRGEGEGARLRYTLTPYTSVGLTAERQRDRFHSASERDSDSVWLMPEVEFQPLALVSGRAQIGFRKRSFRNVQSQDFQGTAARIDLRYTLLGRTVFDVGVQRDLAYSYRVEEEEYILSGARVAVSHRLTDPWDVGFNVSRYGLNYRLLGGGGPDLAETILGFGGEVGYRVGRTRLGVQVDYNKRDTDDASFYRGYDRFRVTSFLTHDF